MRNRIKRLAFVLSICAMGIVAMSAPVRSNLSGEAIENTESLTYTAAAYIQDGLIVLWDGIENVGWGVHSDTITTWTDLVSGLTIPNVTVVDGMAIDYTQNGASKYFTTISNIVSSAYMTFECATQEQSIYANSWRGRSRNGGSTWMDSIALNWSYFKWFGQILRFPSGTYYPNTRSLTADGETVRAYLGGVLASDCPVTEPHIDEGRCLFYSGVKICCVRFYDRPLSAEEIRHNNIIDKARFGL